MILKDNVEVIYSMSSPQGVYWVVIDRLTDTEKIGLLILGLTLKIRSNTPWGYPVFIGISRIVMLQISFRYESLASQK